jgi:hypothetical protein
MKSGGEEDVYYGCSKETVLGVLGYIYSGKLPSGLIPSKAGGGSEGGEGGGEGGIYEGNDSRILGEWKKLANEWELVELLKQMEKEG